VGVAEGGRGGDAEGSYQLMASNSNREPLTLDEIGVLLTKAVRKLSVEERKRLAVALLEDFKGGRSEI
jgi:hypothetical protein